MTQSERILNHLVRRPLNPIEAIKRYGVYRLAARICDLRRDGYDIATERYKYDGDVRTRYRLVGLKSA